MHASLQTDPLKFDLIAITRTITSMHAQAIDMQNRCIKVYYGICVGPVVHCNQHVSWET